MNRFSSSIIPKQLTTKSQTGVLVDSLKDPMSAQMGYHFHLSLYLHLEDVLVDQVYINPIIF